MFEIFYDGEVWSDDLIPNSNLMGLAYGCCVMTGGGSAREIRAVQPPSMKQREQRRTCASDWKIMQRPRTVCGTKVSLAMLGSFDFFKLLSHRIFECQFEYSDASLI